MFSMHCTHSSSAVTLLRQSVSSTIKITNHFVLHHPISGINCSTGYSLLKTAHDNSLFHLRHHFLAYHYHTLRHLHLSHYLSLFSTGLKLQIFSTIDIDTHQTAFHGFQGPLPFSSHVSTLTHDIDTTIMSPRPPICP